MRDAIANVKAAREGLYELAAGGTDVGTGLNAPTGFSREIAQKIAELTGKPFVTAPNKFAALGSLDAMVAAMAAVRGLAVALMKIANDMRWLASGLLRARRARASRQRARLVDHAGQGQPNAMRGDLDVLWPAAEPDAIPALLEGLCALDAAAPKRIDGEIRTRRGDVSWRELAAAWRGDTKIVLVKSLDRAGFMPVDEILAREAAS